MSAVASSFRASAVVFGGAVDVDAARFIADHALFCLARRKPLLSGVMAHTGQIDGVKDVESLAMPLLRLAIGRRLNRRGMLS